jgi:ribonuclease P protein component
MLLTHGPGARLRSRAEFSEVQQHGRRVATRTMTFLALPNALGRDRLGIVASRRMGDAVTRNRAKRRIREMFRQREESVRAAADRRALDLVVIARREVATAPYAELEREFVNAIVRLRTPRTS